MGAQEREMLSGLRRFIVGKVSDTELAESFDDMCVLLYLSGTVQPLHTPGSLEGQYVICDTKVFHIQSGQPLRLGHRELY